MQGCGVVIAEVRSEGEKAHEEERKISMQRRSRIAERAAESMPVGGVKANIGHAEPAAGMTGLLKLAQALERCQAPPNAQLQALNPHVDAALQEMDCVLPTQRAAMRRRAVGGVCGLRDRVAQGRLRAGLHATIHAS